MTEISRRGLLRAIGGLPIAAVLGPSGIYVPEEPRIQRPVINVQKSQVIPGIDATITLWHADFPLDTETVLEFFPTQGNWLMLNNMRLHFEEAGGVASITVSTASGYQHQK